MCVCVCVCVSEQIFSVTVIAVTFKLGEQEKQDRSSKVIEPGAVSFIMTPSVSR